MLWEEMEKGGLSQLMITTTKNKLLMMWIWKGAADSEWECGREERGQTRRGFYLSKEGRRRLESRFHRKEWLWVKGASLFPTEHHRISCYAGQPSDSSSSLLWIPSSGQVVGGCRRCKGLRVFVYFCDYSIERETFDLEWIHVDVVNKGCEYS